MTGRKKWFNFILLVLFIPALHAQVAPVTKPIQPVKLFFEKVYLHTDRDYYTTGEDIWFKVYLVNAQGNGLINTSNNLYVDFISPSSKIVSSEVVNLNNGIGKGDFKLSDTIAPGTYHIRAYTNWMRNFGDNFIFDKPITIRGIAAADRLNRPSTAAGNSKVNNVVGVSAPTVASNHIRFFPEGGSLVDDVVGLVAFKAEGSDGKGITVKGSVTSSAGDTVSRFESTSAGMGSFIFLPQAGLTYTVKGLYDNREPFTALLPVALHKGFVMHLSDADSAHLRVTISTNKATMEDNPGKQVTLSGRHNGQRFLNGPVKFIFLQINALLDKNQFPQGVAALTVYDAQMHPQCERLVYIDKPGQAGGLILQADKKIYSPKEKITVKINTTDSGRAVKANLSLAAVDANLIPVNEGDIVSYLTLQSEVRGNIEHPQTYFDTANINRFKQLDLLLLTQGWRDYLWRRLVDTAIRISYLPESGFSLTGRVRQKFADKAIPGLNILLTVHGEKLSRQYATRTDTTGKYYFSNIRLNGQQPVTLASFDEKKKRVGWIIPDTTTSKPYGLPVRFLPVVYTENENQRLFDKAITEAKKVGRLRLSDTVHLKEVNIKGSKTVILRDEVATDFGYPDEQLTVTPKDMTYERLGDYIIHSSKQARGDVDNNIVFLLERKTYYPRLIVNGKEAPFTDYDPPEVRNEYYNIYYNVPIDMVEKVLIKRMIEPAKLISADASSTQTNALGIGTMPLSSVKPMDNVFIIYLTLKPGALDRKEFNMLDTEISGYYQARDFYKPIYDTKTDITKQDYRTTIHWEPMVITNTNGEANLSFYNAEPKTKVRIVVQGITEKGKPVSALLYYNVQ